MDEVDEMLAETGSEVPLILVVDDEVNYLELLEFNLQQAGYRVATVADGASAVLKAVELQPACILMDGLLPVLHGFEACKAIKNDPATRHVPVIIMTAVYKKLRYKYEVKGEYGADDFITKPFEMDDLLARVRRLVGR